MKIKELQQDVFDLLETELPSHLYYHNLAHTRYVMNAALQLAIAENIPEEDRNLLLSAALLHDTGFTKMVIDHEDVSCDIAKKILPAYGYDATSIDVICSLIMDTKLPQKANTCLGKILCDADLYYLGTDQFFDIGEKLFKEMTALQLICSRDEWSELQVQFLSSHQYFTGAANRMLYEKKLANLFTLKARMRQF